ncbi:hypothetical protein PHYPSEUDO_002717 [Phytophthora pseudosyringae]|uniref:Uncharacterized protein n=1 Tax=Phytophthora pseudosyringae TaxID=221518 RepID=A0A8T1WJY1_9STRA|nr:hypothetical protein PHYPSEUDO_002717 [Phytophthora pseudosyringae]
MERLSDGGVATEKKKTEGEVRDFLLELKEMEGKEKKEINLNTLQIMVELVAVCCHYKLESEQVHELKNVCFVEPKVPDAVGVSFVTEPFRESLR